MPMARLRRPEARARMRRRRCRDRASIDSYLPLGTVLVALLVTVMAAQPSITHGVPLDVPSSQHAHSVSGAMREDAVRILVLRDGAMYFGHTAVEPREEEIADRVREALARGAETRVYLEVDQRAPYGVVSIALDSIRHAGIVDVTFLTAAQHR